MTSRSFSCARIAQGRFLTVALLWGALIALGAPLHAQVPINVLQFDQQHPILPRVYDSEPSAVELADGTVWVAWHAYAQGSERIVARPIRENDGGAAIEISAGPGVYGDPEIAAAADGALWVIFPSLEGERWILRARAIRNNRADNALHQVSSLDTDVPLPAAVLPGHDGLRVAWSAYSAGRFRILTREWREDAWSEPEIVSQATADAFRPALAEDAEGNVWIFWDAYANGESAIFGRPVSPYSGPIEQISEPGNRHLRPVAASAGEAGLCVAWVKAIDITGGGGVIDQVHTMRMAVRRDNRWELIRDPEGNPEGVVVTRGLLAKLEPTPQPTGGYMGRRRHPMLLEENGALWLVWERKTSQVGSTFLISGDLLGRRFNGEQWEEPVVFRQGEVDYRLAAEARVKDGAFTVIASTMPRHGQRIYHRSSQAIDDHGAFEQEEWLGWRPVQLPLRQRGERFEIREGDKTYKIFWMDSHAHSRLSSDAEGEPDEILFYARDRALLDAVVMQENDFYIVPLTEYEYRLGKFFGRVLSSHEFLALPGFEWTSRIPRSEEVSRAEPIFWGVGSAASFPNHRTVIYPSSGGPLVRYTEVENDIGRLYDAVAKHGGVVHAQHAVFRLTGHPVEIGAEVAAGWGTYFLQPEHIHNQLKNGHRIGFVGTTDSHRRNPGLNGGLTGILAEELTSEAILDAYRARRIYGTTGSRIGLESRANGVLMGQETVASGPVTLTLRVEAPRPIMRAVLVRNGEDIATFDGGRRNQQTFSHREVSLPRGEHFFYWRVEIEGNSRHYGGNVMVAEGHLGWTTPNWVKVP